MFVCRERSDSLGAFGERALRLPWIVINWSTRSCGYDFLRFYDWSTWKVKAALIFPFYAGLGEAMFTGIVEDIGTVRSRQPALLSIDTRLDDIKIGDSVAVNGVCLTARSVASKGGDVAGITFDFSPETACRTNLENLSAGAQVNLERALKVGDRLGGHFLTGHVETTGKLLKKKAQGEFTLLTFALPDEMARYVASKGSVGVDGISLTVADVMASAFSVAVIPHTIEHTTLMFRRIGDAVNLEPDILAKYVERIFTSTPPQNGMTRGFLAQHGF